MVSTEVTIYLTFSQLHKVLHNQKFDRSSHIPAGKGNILFEIRLGEVWGVDSHMQDYMHNGLMWEITCALTGVP